ncbi:hypothetical protein EG329_008624 [Mollisiaceae sp. DMI_Dod_QoI]|nr:hypothetical protein EG329_008624 [Helotiales sp. DMI_Dod_QoI]
MATQDEDLEKGQHALKSQEEPGQPQDILRDYASIITRLNGKLLNNAELRALNRAVQTECESLESDMSSIRANLIHRHDPSSADEHDGFARLKRLNTQRETINAHVENHIRTLENDLKPDSDFDIKESLVKDQPQQVGTQQKQDQIKRPSTPVELKGSEACDADLGNQTVLKSHRVHDAQLVLDAVKERHRKILDCEERANKLAQLIVALNDAVVTQVAATQVLDAVAKQSLIDTKVLNDEIDQSIGRFRSARRTKWWCTGIGILTILALALVLGLYFGLR